MKRLATLAALALTVPIALFGCDDRSQPPAPAGEHRQGDGHDHGAHEGHDHGSHEGHDHAGHADADHHDHGLGPIQIAGRTVTLTLHGDVVAGKAVHGDIKVDGGSIAALRGWVGTQSAEGSLKSKATGSGASFHIDLEAPATLPEGAAIWLEVQTEDAREAKSLAIPKH